MSETFYVPGVGSYKAVDTKISTPVKMDFGTAFGIGQQIINAGYSIYQTVQNEFSASQSSKGQYANYLLSQGQFARSLGASARTMERQVAVNAINIQQYALQGKMISRERESVRASTQRQINEYRKTMIVETAKTTAMTASSGLQISEAQKEAVKQNVRTINKTVKREKNKEKLAYQMAGTQIKNIQVQQEILGRQNERLEKRAEEYRDLAEIYDENYQKVWRGEYSQLLQDLYSDKRKVRNNALSELSNLRNKDPMGYQMVMRVHSQVTRFG